MSSWRAHPLPSGSLKKTNLPHGNSWTSVTATPRPSQLGPGGSHVRHDDLETAHRTRLRVGEPVADGDRAGRSGRGQLDEAELIVDLVVVVGVEADLVRVERLGAVDIGDRDRHQLELPIHDGPPSGRLRFRADMTECCHEQGTKTTGYCQ